MDLFKLFNFLILLCFPLTPIPVYFLGASHGLILYFFLVFLASVFLWGGGGRITIKMFRLNNGLELKKGPIYDVVKNMSYRLGHTAPRIFVIDNLMDVALSYRVGKTAIFIFDRVMINSFTEIQLRALVIEELIKMEKRILSIRLLEFALLGIFFRITNFSNQQDSAEIEVKGLALLKKKIIRVVVFFFYPMFFFYFSFIMGLLVRMLSFEKKIFDIDRIVIEKLGDFDTYAKVLLKRSRLKYERRKMNERIRGSGFFENSNSLFGFLKMWPSDEVRYEKLLDYSSRIR